MSEPRKLDEEKDRNVIDGWYESARGAQTVEDLTKFVADLREGYVHDYGTICHAVAAAGLAAMWVVDRGPQGGITGFQAGCIMWEFIEKWMHEPGPKRLFRFEHLLYPQYDSGHRQVPKSVHEWLVKKARELVASSGDTAHPNVVRRWREVAEGNLPAGWTVGE